MAQLKPDEIKWILSIDAKGVNKEIAVASSEINKLAQANKIMAADMKLAEKQIQLQEKELKRLTQAGLENSNAYKEAKATRDSAKNDLDDYTRKIGENNRAIETNKNKITELKEGMDINEMSMKQLKERAAQLSTQLNVTSASTNPEEYKSLQKELSIVNKRMGEVKVSGMSVMDNLASIPGPAGAAIRSFQGIATAMKALIANPIGAIIMVVVGAFMALKTAINSSEEASNKFQQIIAPVRLILDGLLKILQKVVGAMLSLSQAIVGWAAKAAEKLPFVGKYMEDVNKKSEKAIQLEKDKADLRKREYTSIESNAKKEAEIADLRFKAKQRDKYSNEEIVGFLDQAIALEGEIAQEKIEQAKISLNLLEIEASRKEQTEEMNRKIAEQRALVYQLEANELKRTREMEAEKQERIRAEKQAQIAAAKEALDRQIADVDYAMKEEVKLLSQQLAEQLITREQYEKTFEQISMRNLNKKLEIAGLERDQRIDIEQQVLDAKIAALEQDRQLNEERIAMANTVRSSFMDKDNQELQGIRDRYDARLKELKLSLEKEAITELEFNEYKAILLEERETALNEQRKIQKEARAAEVLSDQDEEYQAEKLLLMEQYANKLLDEEAYRNAVLALDEEFARRSLEISDLSDDQKRAAREKLLQFMINKNNEETKKQEEDQKKRAQLYSDFSVQIGETLGAVISGNEDLVKSSLKALINMALDALKAQVQIAIVGVTAQGLAQSMLNPAAMAKAAIKIALIEAAFAAVKGVIGSAFSTDSKNSQESTNSVSTGTYVVTGRKDGGFVDVTRAQDKKKYIATFNPNKRGFINRPTVIVGDGPTGRSAEWVASNDALQNPTIAPFIKLLDESQKAGNIRTIDLNHIMRARMAGFESGGFIDRSSPSSGSQPITTPVNFQSNRSNDEDLQLKRDIRELLLSLKNNGVSASVVLSDLQRKQDLLNKSQRIGTRS